MREWWAYFLDYRDLSIGTIQSTMATGMCNNSAELKVIEKGHYDKATTLIHHLEQENKRLFGEMITAQGCQENAENSLDHAKFEISRLENHITALEVKFIDTGALIRRLEASIRKAEDCRTNEDAWAAVEIERGCLREIELWKVGK